MRPTVYEIHKRPDADYHLFQFHGGVDLLEQLDHTLKITDGVLRFRIIKLRAGTPPPPRWAPPPLRPPPRASLTSPSLTSSRLRQQSVAICGAPDGRPPI